MSLISDIFLQTIFVFIACCFFYTIGCMLLPNCKLLSNSNIFGSLYAKLILGLVAFISLYAVVATQFKSVHIITLLASILIIIFAKKSETKSLNNNKNVLHFLWMSLFFVCMFHVFPEGESKQLDSAFYLNIAFQFNDTGHENSIGLAAIHDTAFSFSSMYHFFEIWLNASLLQITKFVIPAIDSFRFVGYSIIGVGAFCGILALIEVITNNSITKKEIFIAILFFLLQINFSLFFPFIQKLVIFPIENNFFERPNLRTLFLFLPGLLISIKVNIKFVHLLFWTACFLCSSLINFVVFIPLISFLFLLSLTFKNWQNDKLIILKLFVAIIITSLVYLIFYIITGNNTHSIIVKNPFQLWINNFITHWKGIIYNIFIGFIYSMILPFLILLYLKIKNKIEIKEILSNKQLILSAIFLVISLLIARSLMYLDNGYQFAYPAFVGVLFFIFYLVVKYFRTCSSIVTGVISIHVIALFVITYIKNEGKLNNNIFFNETLSFYNGKKFTSDYRKEIKRIFENVKITRGGFIQDKEYTKNLFYSYRNNNVYYLTTNYLITGLVKQNYIYSLSTIEIDKNLPAIEKNYLEASDAVSYIKYYKGNLNSFIKEHKLHYLVCTKNVNTDSLSLINYYQKITDVNTGEQLILLKSINK